MKNNEILLSICIPTYGVMEWVIPVLDSIYSQNVNKFLFEVVVTDNGTNQEFFDKMQELVKKYRNLRYIKTNSYSFLNEIDSYKNARGKFIKFINHRTKMNDGSVNYLIDFVKKNEKEKPVVYFSNSELKKNEVLQFDCFNDFVKNLSIYSSWSTGMAFWKEHFDMMSTHENFNELFPHTDILFDRKKEEKYIIDDTYLLSEITASQKNKGKYDLFHAFAVEYPALILNLYRENFIDYKTFEFVRKENLKFIRRLYFDFVIRKKDCSYDITNFNNSIKFFYSKNKVKKAIPFIFIKTVFIKIARIFKKKK